MDYRSYYKKASREADKIQAKLELGSKKESDPKGLVPKKEKELEEVSPFGDFNPAEYMARIRMDASVSEQISGKDEDETKSPV